MTAPETITPRRLWGTLALAALLGVALGRATVAIVAAVDNPTVARVAGFVTALIVACVVAVLLRSVLTRRRP